MSKKEIRYFGKSIKEYDKSRIVNNFFEKLNEIINNKSKTKSEKEREIEELFKSQFLPIQIDIIEKLQRLINENTLQKTNIENGNVNNEMAKIAHSLNAYSNELLGYYKNSYYKIINPAERKKFIRDLRFLLSTFGIVQQSLGNVIYGENRLSEANIKNSPSNKSELMKRFEKWEKEKRGIDKSEIPKDDSSPMIQKSSIKEDQLIKNPVTEVNFRNNGNNCYRNSVIHLLLTLLRDNDFKGNLNNAFAIQSGNTYNIPKNNLKKFLSDCVENKEIHTQSILTTYNPMLTSISEHSTDLNGYFKIDDYVFKLKNKINGSEIKSFQDLYIYYPPLDGTIKNENDFYEKFKTNLTKALNIEKGLNQNYRDSYYFDKIINSVYKSYGNAQSYLYHLLHFSNIFSPAFLNKLKINNNSYLKELYYTTNNSVPSLKAIINNAQESFESTALTNNKYVLISIGDTHSFINYDFDNLYIINKKYYQLSDIVYASGGHYISLNMRNGSWFKYDDLSSSSQEVTGNNKFNLESSGFFPNIFLLINTEVEATTAGGAKSTNKKTKSVKAKATKAKSVKAKATKSTKAKSVKVKSKATKAKVMKAKSTKVMKAKSVKAKRI